MHIISVVPGIPRQFATLVTSFDKPMINAVQVQRSYTI
jgi:hypothetical protein